MFDDTTSSWCIQVLPLFLRVVPFTVMWEKSQTIGANYKGMILGFYTRLIREEN